MGQSILPKEEELFYNIHFLPDRYVHPISGWRNPEDGVWHVFLPGSSDGCIQVTSMPKGVNISIDQQNIPVNFSFAPELSKPLGITFFRDNGEIGRAHV